MAANDGGERGRVHASERAKEGEELKGVSEANPDGSRGSRGISGEARGKQAERRCPGRVAARAGRVPVLLAGRKMTGG